MVKIITMRQIGHFCDIACKYEDSGCFHPNQYDLTQGYMDIAKFLEEKRKRIKELNGENMFFAQREIAKPAVYLYKNCLVENKGKWKLMHIVKLAGYSPTIDDLTQEIDWLTQIYYNWSKNIQGHDKQMDITQYDSISALEKIYS